MSTWGKFMKLAILSVLFIYASISYAQEAVVDITLRPAGSFKVKSTEVKGHVVAKGDGVEAKNIVVGLTNVKTGIGLRDEHTRKYLDVQKFPTATLVSATGKAGKGEGVIKIRGIEKKIEGTYKMEASKLVGAFPIKLSDFGITGIKYMGVGVQDEATVHVSIPKK